MDLRKESVHRYATKLHIKEEITPKADPDRFRGYMSINQRRSMENDLRKGARPTVQTLAALLLLPY